MKSQKNILHFLIFARSVRLEGTGKFPELSINLARVWFKGGRETYIRSKICIIDSKNKNICLDIRDYKYCLYIQNTPCNDYFKLKKDDWNYFKKQLDCGTQHWFGWIHKQISKQRPKTVHTLRLGSLKRSGKIFRCIKGAKMQSSSKRQMVWANRNIC